MDEIAFHPLRRQSTQDKAIIGMLAQSLDLFGRLGPSMVLGTTLMLLATATGWLLAKYQGFLFVRWINWWLRRVVLPLLRSRSWLRRTTAIFANNTLVLSGMLLLGSWQMTSRLGVILVGLALGVALRQLGAYVDDSEFLCDPATPGERRRFRIGIALNLLEIGAIIVTLGLAVGTVDLKASLEQVWKLFIVWVMPTLLVAAGGEALWMGVAWEGVQVRRQELDVDGNNGDNARRYEGPE